MSERGALLFRVSPNRHRDQFVWLLAAVAILVVMLIVPLLEHRRMDAAFPFFAAFYGAMFFIQRRAAVYEKGIQLPADTSGARSRFIMWSQVERIHWDGDVLTIVPTSSIIGGADLGRPLLGGSVRIPAEKRAQMENLLAGTDRAR